MNIDNDYTIGHDHVICEDYSLSYVDAQFGDAVAVVCDGCSASIDVDLGARILAKSAQNTILLHGLLDYDLFGATTILNAKKIFDVLPTLHQQALDATLLIAYVKDGLMTCYMYGDGVFIHKSKNNTRLVHIDFLSGAPAYLSYNLDPKRKERYNTEANMSKHVVDTIDGSFEPKSLNPFQPVIITSPVNDGDIISVCSDGINSFRKADNEPISWKDLVEEYAGYKNFTGEFVKRRMNAFKRKCAKELTTHSDDISVASIII